MVIGVRRGSRDADRVAIARHTGRGNGTLDKVGIRRITARGLSIGKAQRGKGTVDGRCVNGLEGGIRAIEIGTSRKNGFDFIDKSLHFVFRSAVVEDEGDVSGIGRDAARLPKTIHLLLQRPVGLQGVWITIEAEEGDKRHHGFRMGESIFRHHVWIISTNQRIRSVDEILHQGTGALIVDRVAISILVIALCHNGQSATTK